MLFQTSSSDGSKVSEPVMRKLSRDEESFVSELQRTYRVSDRHKVMRAVDLLRSLDQSVVNALRQLDSSVVRRSMAGNAEAQRVGDRILRRLTEFVGKTPPSSGPSHSGAEKRRADDVPVRSSQPPEKVARVSESSRDRGDGGRSSVGTPASRGGPPGRSSVGPPERESPGRPPNRSSMGPPSRSNPRPLLDRPDYMDDRRSRDWNEPSNRGGMIRGGYPMSGYSYRPPPRGRYGHGPYY